MTKDDVISRKSNGYVPETYFKTNNIIRAAIERMYCGINGCAFEEVANSLRYNDPYMVLADFDSYQQAQRYASQCYKDAEKWNKMSLENIAGAGIFSADRAVEDYARDIWHLLR